MKNETPRPGGNVPGKEYSPIISNRIEQYISAMNMLENIRWRFIASFGLGAFIALFLNVTGSNSHKAAIAGILAIIVSFAGIVSQIRIFGLVMEIWCRIRELQNKEFNLFPEKKDYFSGVEEFLVFPRLDHGKFIKKIFTVHTATCFVFSSLIGISIYLIIRSSRASCLSVLLGILSGIGFLTLSLFATSKYLRILEKERESTVSVGKNGKENGPEI